METSELQARQASRPTATGISTVHPSLPLGHASWKRRSINRHLQGTASDASPGQREREMTMTRHCCPAWSDGESIYPVPLLQGPPEGGGVLPYYLASVHRLLQQSKTPHSLGKSTSHGIWSRSRRAQGRKRCNVLQVTRTSISGHCSYRIEAATLTLRILSWSFANSLADPGRE